MKDNPCRYCIHNGATCDPTTMKAKEVAACKRSRPYHDNEGANARRVRQRERLGR